MLENKTTKVSGSIYNRDKFLNNIAEKLGRNRKYKNVIRPTLKYSCHWEVMADFTQDQLKDELIKFTKETLGMQTLCIKKSQLAETLRTLCAHYCAKADVHGNTLFSADKRLLAMLNPQDLVNAKHSVHIWDASAGYKANIKFAEQANVGVVFAEYALAESGTVVLYNSALQGRAISLLPEASIFIVLKSSLLPRMTQATRILNEKIKTGERIPSCINFISGPSSTADIELIKVVGAHGPIYATYVIIDDM